MKLLSKNKYEEIENILYNYEQNIYNKQNIIDSISELEEFFENSPPHIYFLKTYYFNRYKYKNRYPKNDNVGLFKKICKDLYIEIPTGYLIKKELIYKTAMIFYKNEVID